MRTIITHAIKLIALIAILPLATISPSHTSSTQAGSPFVVTTTADTGTGSFRQALTDANAAAGADTITFDPAVFPVATPATIHATATYVIEAPAASDPLTINASGAGVIFDFTGITEGEAAFHWRPDGPVTGVTLNNFTIQNFAPDNHHAGHGVEVGNAPTTVANLRFEDMTIVNNQQNALFLNADDKLDALIEGNNLSDNGGNGVQIGAGTTGEVFIQVNEIHRNSHGGVEIDVTDPTLSSAARIVANNISDNGGDGVFIAGQESVNTIHATISGNIITHNGGLGINLLGFGSEIDGVTENDFNDVDMGPNELLNYPVLNGAASGIVGTACANCTIEIYISDNDPSGHGEGAEQLGEGQADVDGNFNIVACASAGTSVTATATNAVGSTSEFALNYVLPTDTGIECVPDVGDNDCDGDEDARDALMEFIHEVNLPQLSQTGDCFSLGSNVFPVTVQGSIGPSTFGDVNCDNDVNTTDGILLLRHFANLALVPSPPPDCTQIGQPYALP